MFGSLAELPGQIPGLLHKSPLSGLLGRPSLGRGILSFLQSLSILLLLLGELSGAFLESLLLCRLLFRILL